MNRKNVFFASSNDHFVERKSVNRRVEIEKKASDYQVSDKAMIKMID